ncbi:Alpha/Beta hydrolase protein [Aspergillus granulosus]|uniref:Carboxylic ester hydrolase n=1 Tax=Aspergillus granulosus TaxID=176169 RepID=A0ABR4I2W1_9EURO
MGCIIHIAVIACVAVRTYAAGNAYPTVNLGYASYRGIHNETSNTNEWYGIRYAQPPTGELRFRAPQDIEVKNNYSTSQPMDATTVPPACVQGNPAWLPMSLAASGQATGQEDCLVLNVLAPAGADPSSELPVMVQIHGGGYTLGNTQAAPGNALVYQSNGGLIYVAIQYRLGAYGFLGGPEVLENGDANVGLLDQRAALLWVQRHIRTFGGDPSKVTIIGGSAGGGSVSDQMILYGGVPNPPFRGVIAEYPWWQPYHNDSILSTQYNLLLDATNCSSIACLRQLPADDLANATQSTYITGYSLGRYGFGDFYYGPYVDGNVVRQLPSQEFKQGHFSQVALLVNHELYEGYFESNMSQTTQEDEIADMQKLFPYAKRSFINKILELYPASNYNSTFFQREDWFGDFIVKCPTYYMATAVSDWGNSVYKLSFAAGAQTHGAIIPFTETTALNGTANNVTLASIMRNWYISFATDLDPNAASYTNVEKPYWPTYMNAQNGNFSVISVTDTTISVVEDQDASAKCDYLHSQSYVVRN